MIQTLKPTLKPAQRSQHCLRYYGHILNLAAKAFLWGTNVESFERNMTVQTTLQDDQAKLLLWRKKDLMSKLHNVVTYIWRSPQRQKHFTVLYDEEATTAGLSKEDQEFGRKLLKDNKTRWNGTYLMGKRGINLRDHILVFLTHNKDSQPVSQHLSLNNHITSEDWRVIIETVTLLKPFYNQTKRLQSRASNAFHGALWEAYPSIRLLIQHLKDAKDEYSIDNDTLDLSFDDEVTIAARCALRISLNNCWVKLDQYYQIFDKSPIYAAAGVLHPAYKWHYFETQWMGLGDDDKLSTLRNDKKAVKRLWELEYKTLDKFGYVTALGEGQVQRREPDALAEFVPPPGFYNN